IHDRNGLFVGELRPPRAPALVNETFARFREFLQHHPSLDAVFDKTRICCQVLRNQSVFISAAGHAYPCCWTYVQATAPILHEFRTGVDTQMYDLVQDTGGFARIDALKLGLAAVVDSPLFGAVERSWEKTSLAAGRLKVCARVCGIDFPAF